MESRFRVSIGPAASPLGWWKASYKADDRFSTNFDKNVFELGRRSDEQASKVSKRIFVQHLARHNVMRKISGVEYAILSDRFD
ncbi:hypothetical protein XI06_13035 [Bradyrhizobium sp. CCBAU 11434]|nr:hypothetical protein [Bradyrhizobium sp. CCBAU 11434]